MSEFDSAIETAARAMFDVAPFRENSSSYEDQSDEFRRLCRAYATAAIRAYEAHKASAVPGEIAEVVRMLVKNAEIAKQRGKGNGGCTFCFTTWRDWRRAADLLERLAKPCAVPEEIADEVVKRIRSGSVSLDDAFRAADLLEQLAKK